MDVEAVLIMSDGVIGNLEGSTDLTSLSDTVLISFEKQYT